jgi:hypothetical protein
MNENVGINARTLETFLGKVVRIRIASNQHFVTGKIVNVSEDVVLMKKDGKRTCLRRSDIADVSEIE